MRAQQKGIVPLSQGYFPELRRNCMCLSTPIWVSSARKPKKTARKSAAAQTTEPLQRWQAAVEVIISFTISLRGEQWSISVCGCCNVMIRKTFCTFPNPSTNPQCTVSKQHTVWHWDNVLRQEQQFDWPLHFCLQWEISSSSTVKPEHCNILARLSCQGKTPPSEDFEKLTKVSNSTWFLNWGSG